MFPVVQWGSKILYMMCQVELFQLLQVSKYIYLKYL
jgi:hypothetical protein